VKAGLADGSIRVVIGTHALAGKGVEMADLGLLIVDEEQRFGAATKEKLRALGETAHVLTLTATPIPRTMQAALVGLQDVSVLATPPAERRPVRTIVSDFDDATVREALMREHRRGGQSFVVCPRIEDIEPMAARLKALAPELDCLVAHGKMPAEEIDETMVRFADGDGDVLLATNIIESGLDVPNANTIMVWHPDRFGLSQLHQLRGRVGRGRLRGAAYLLTDPETQIPEATRKRLTTLETLDRLGAGFAISAEDLEQRGAGDLLGDTQAGHVKLIGAGLYRRLLERALILARGETPPPDWNPELNVGVGGRIAAEYIPEPEVRINLYARIARGNSDSSDLLAEIGDRFGPVPDEVANLIALQRLKAACRDLGIARVDAGPQAIAFTFTERKLGEAALKRWTKGGGTGLDWKGERLVLQRATGDADRLPALEEVLREIGRA
jgi:transcription-repair coupling factor (superfamily II helicase)